jgi:hypothetical protein
VPMADVVDYFDTSDRRMMGVFDVQQCLRLYRVETAD